MHSTMHISGASNKPREKIVNMTMMIVFRKIWNAICTMDNYHGYIHCRV